MVRVTKKDKDGHYYMTGDGIFSDWGVPEKFKGEDVDVFGYIEDILGDTYDLEVLRKFVNANRNNTDEKHEPKYQNWIMSRFERVE